MFVTKAWYVAATSEDLGAQPLARTILDQPMVLYRTSSGEPVVLYDRCCHRQAPLSLGEIVDGENIRCNYHGLVYDPAGVCVHIPGQTSIPPGATVRRFPSVERYGWIWIWPADPKEADASCIPDYSWNEAQGFRAVGERIHMKGNYQLLVDNLMDLSHLAYLHPRTIGVADVAEKASTRHRVDDETVVVERETLDHPVPPGLAKVYGYDGRIDRWQSIRFVNPNGVIIQSAIAPVGTARDPAKRESGWVQRILNSITPETEGSSHYFWKNARNFAKEDPRYDAMTMERIRMTFDEDKVMIEGQQRRFGLDGGDGPVDINVDAGPMAARRIVERTIAAERPSVGAE